MKSGRPSALYIDAFQVPSEAIIIQSVPNQEFIGYTKAKIIYFNIMFQRIRLEKQGNDPDRFRMEGFYLIQKFIHRLSRINDILYDDDISSFQVVGDSEYFLQRSAAFRAIIGSIPHENNFAVDLQLFHQISGKHEYAVKYAYE